MSYRENNALVGLALCALAAAGYGLWQAALWLAKHWQCLLFSF